MADLDLPDTGIWLGPGRHFVHYWVRRRELLNVVAVFGTESAQESWTARAEPGEQLRAFDGWDPRVLGVLERTGQVFRWGIHTRTPLARWNVGRVTLLGDSAHAMVPFQAQGAAQAILDAAVLGASLTGGGTRRRTRPRHPSTSTRHAPTGTARPRSPSSPNTPAPPAGPIHGPPPDLRTWPSQQCDRWSMDP
ncbi:hypothetical protein GCM10022403_052350 [Streptomyces coacervatus]|uniref:FAD-binding domain-containing protein n=1 Tax=Streptomyces coacervatus TaxID=647381 RepID=A0ABP7I8D3_9ACTN